MEKRTLLNELRLVLKHLYNVDKLETLSLTQELVGLAVSTDPNTRGLQLRMTVMELIESLKPDGDVNYSTLEWRWYTILHDRYILCHSLWKIEQKLSLGNRQVRREHVHALNTLMVLLAQRLAAKSVSTLAHPEFVATPIEAAVYRFSPVFRVFSLNLLLEEVTSILREINRNQPSEVKYVVQPDNLTVYADRGILHLLLLKILGRLTHSTERDGWINLEARTEPQGVDISIVSNVHLVTDDEDIHLCQLLARTMRAELKIDRVAASETRLSLVVPIGTSLRRVFVIDDEQSAIELFTSYLVGLEYDVSGESNPKQAIKRAVEVQPDVILVDVMMPAVDGWDLLQRLHITPQLANVPIIVCSVINDADLAYALGAARFLRKPVLRQQLVMTLHEVLPQPAPTNPE
jgi:CheY-like chemotaxis protein